MDGFSGEKVKVGRMWVMKVRGNLSIMDMHYLIAEQNGEARHYVDRHELGLFDRDAMLELMRQAGLRSKFFNQDLSPQRGVFVGVKAQS